MNLTKTNWPKGWLPSNDAINGDPEGLLRSDNLRFDKSGAIGLIDGMQATTASYSDFVSALFTRIINNNEYLWAAVGNPVSTITRSQGPTGITTLMIPDGGAPSGQACFGDAFGYTLACAGGFRVKDPVQIPVPFGPTTVIPLGMLTPNPPTVAVNSQTTVTIPHPDLVVEGTGTAPSVILDPTTLEGSICSSSQLSIDTITIGGNQANDPGQDLFSFPFTVVDQPASVITQIELDLILDGTVSDPSTWNNYYQFILKNDFDQIQGGLNTKTTLSISRWQNSRFGTDQTLDWKKVIGVRFLVTATAACTCTFGDIVIAGGVKSGLNGTYTYIQLDLRDDGHYQAKSPTSAATTPLLFINGSATITPSIRDAHATEHWFFRKAEVNTVGINSISGQPLTQSVLNQYYFVGKTLSGASFQDDLNDTEVLQLNSDGSLLPNRFLKTLNTNDTVNGLQDFIFGIEGLFNERILYMGSGFLYLSDRLNPDAVDARFTLKPSGDPGEKNLWIKKLTNDVIMLATTKDLYSLTGTLLEQPDGTIDARLIKVGESIPPLSVDVCNYNGALYYVSADGMRVTTGTNSTNISPQLRHLFQHTIINLQGGSTTRHGVPGVAIYDGVGVNYSVAAAHGNIYFVVPLQDGTRRVFVYDTVTKTYSLRFTDPIKLFTTQAGELLAAYGASSGNRVYIYDAVPGYGVDGVGIPFKLRTVFDPNGQPRNRKDLFTLKLVMDTGGDEVSVDIQRDGIGVTENDEGSWRNLGRYSTTGMQTIYISLGVQVFVPALSLGFRYAIQLSDVNGVKSFRLAEMTIEYEPRPEQLNYLNVLPTNMGTISRKRWTAFAFVIDTLGQDILFNPILDGVPWIADASAVPVCNTSGKQTFIYYFLSEAIATDMGILLVSKNGPLGYGANGPPFEFYTINLEQCISEKLPPPVKYLIIPPENYGTPNRKRHTSYKFQILTRGKNVQFTPRLDGIEYTVAVFNTTLKQTVDYYFPQSSGDVIGVDIGGVLQSLENTPFEYYGNVKPQTIEVLPDRLEYLRIPNNNFGVPSKKRVRTLPLVIDTHGKDVSFTPIVDGVAGTPRTLNTNGKVTTYYYFNTDSFGTDYGGTLSGGNVFEFYEMLRPADVEILPVPKLLDQLGPIRLDKIGKVFGFRLRMIQSGTTTSLPWAVYDDFNSQINPAESNPLASGTLTVVPNYDEIYEVQFPKNVNATVLRLTLGPVNDPFYRYDIFLKVQTSGMESQSKWIPIR